MQSIDDMLVYSLNPTKDLNGKMRFIDHPGLRSWFFGTEDLLFCKYYAGGMAFRIMCKARPDGNEFPTITSENWGKTLVSGPALIFGCTKRGWQRSLTDKEVNFLASSGGLVSLETNRGLRKIGYALTGFSDKQKIEFWEDDN